MNWNDKKAYWISRFIIPILAFCIIKIIFIIFSASNTDKEFIEDSIKCVTVFSFIISFPSTIVSKLMIKIGNNFNSKIGKILYYLLLLPIILHFSLGVIMFIISFIDAFFDILNFSRAIILLITGIITIAVIYLQTIIVLTIYHFTKNKLI